MAKTTVKELEEKISDLEAEKEEFKDTIIELRTKIDMIKKLI